MFWPVSEKQKPTSSSSLAGRGASVLGFRPGFGLAGMTHSLDAGNFQSGQKSVHKHGKYSPVAHKVDEGVITELEEPCR